MECKHEFIFETCNHCGKHADDIVSDLTVKLAASEQALAAEREKREQAAAQCATQKERLKMYHDCLCMPRGTLSSEEISKLLHSLPTGSIWHYIAMRWDIMSEFYSTCGKQHAAFIQALNECCEWLGKYLWLHKEDEPTGELYNKVFVTLREPIEQGELIVKQLAAKQKRAEQAEAKLKVAYEFADKQNSLAYEWYLRHAWYGIDVDDYCEELGEKCSDIEHDSAYQTWRAEQAEAQASVMREQLEKYIRGNCKVIRHAVADGLGYPEDVDGKCGGYAGEFGDEPCDPCKECIAMAYNEEANEEIADVGTALLAEHKALRPALESCLVILESINTHERISATICKTPISPGIAAAIKTAREALNARNKINVSKNT